MTDLPFRVEPPAPRTDEPLEYAFSAGRARVTVRLGERRTGGHSITVTRITRDAAVLTITCEIRTPEPDAIVIQVLTSPAQTVSVDASGVQGVRDVVLIDGTGAELARISA
jgi:hypothetical protein